MALFLHLMAWLVFPMTQPQIGVLVIPETTPLVSTKDSITEEIVTCRNWILLLAVAFIPLEHVSHNQISETVNSSIKIFLVNKNLGLDVLIGLNYYKCKSASISTRNRYGIFSLIFCPKILIKSTKSIVTKG